MVDRQLCTFRIGGLHVGIDVALVQEVLADPDIIPVPRAAPAVSGLLNLRGQILTVIDARTVLGLPDPGHVGRTHVILHGGEEIVSVMVDRDDEVLDIDPGLLQDVPSTISEAIRACSSAAYELDDDLLLVLDIELLLAAATDGPGGTT